MADGVLEGGGTGGGGVDCLEGALEDGGAGLSTTRSPAEYTELAGDSTFCRALGASEAALLAALGGGGGAGGESEEACFLFPAKPGFSAGNLRVVRPVSPDNACAGPLARPEEAAPVAEEEAGVCS